MVKVISKGEHEHYFGACKSLQDLPTEFLIHGQVFYDTEEAFLLQTRENHEELCGLELSMLHSLQKLWPHEKKRGVVSS